MTKRWSTEPKPVHEIVVQQSNDPVGPRIRIGLLISNISRLGGGVSAFVVKLAQALHAANIEPVIFTAQDNYLEEDRSELAGIEIVSRSLRGPATIGYLPGLLSDM